MIIEVRRENVKIRAVRLWHKWFVWFPIRVVQAGKKDRLVWLETVERKLVRTPYRHQPWRYIYRIESSPKTRPNNKKA